MQVERCGSCLVQAKLHITVGHNTVMAEAQFFGLPDGSPGAAPDQAAALRAAGMRVERLAQAVCVLPVAPALSLLPFSGRRKGGRGKGGGGGVLGTLLLPPPPPLLPPWPCNIQEICILAAHVPEGQSSACHAYSPTSQGPPSHPLPPGGLTVRPSLPLLNLQAFAFWMPGS